MDIQPNYRPLEQNPLNISPSDNGSILTRGSIQSPNFVENISGWKIDKEGVIEVNDLDLRGKIKFYTDFESSSRFSTSLVSDGTISFGGNGASLATTATQASSARLGWALTGSSASNIFDSDPTFSVVIYGYNLGVSGAGSAFFGMGDVGVGGNGHVFDDNCAGFYLLDSSGVYTLYAIQSNTTSSTQSVALTTMVEDDVIDLIIKVKSNNRFIYFWRKNSGDLSMPTVLKTSLPASQAAFQFSVSNNNTTNSMTIICSAASYER